MWVWPDVTCVSCLGSVDTGSGPWHRVRDTPEPGPTLLSSPETLRPIGAGDPAHREGEWQMNKVCCPQPCFIFCHFWHQACDYTGASEKLTLQLDITWNTFLTAQWQLVINLNKKESNHFLLNLIYPQEQGLKQFNNQSQITQCFFFVNLLKTLEFTFCSQI